MYNTSSLLGAQRLDGMYFSPIRQVGERAAALAAEGKPVIFFSASEPDFNTPEPIKRAAIRAIQKDRSHYAPNRGTLALRQAIAAQLAETIGVRYDPAGEILVTVGGAEAVNNAFLAFLDPGDEVIVFTPAAINYENLIAMCGASMVDIPLRKENGFQIDPDELQLCITDQTRMIVINNPCNPTGVVYTEEVLREIAALAVKHNLLVFSDELYNRFVYDGRTCRSIASFPGMRERTIVMNSFSKAYAMTGWRMGYLAMDAALYPSVLKVHHYTTTCAPTMIQDALAQTMNAPETLDAVSAMVRTFDTRRKVLMQGLDRMDVLTYTVPEGAFYLFIDVSGTGMDGDDFARRLLEEHYVACVPGSKLGGHCGDFVRLSYAAGEAQIREGLSRIKTFLDS